MPDSPFPPPLQFDTAVVTGGTPSPAGNSVVCGQCQQPVLTEYYDVNTIAMCESCRTMVEEQMAGPAGVDVWLRALLFGLGATIAGAILYYAVAAVADLEVGLVAIAIGYMVGYAMRRGTGGRGSRSLQVVAVVLTYWSVGLAYTSLAIRSQPESTGAGLAQLVAFTFVTPLLVVFGSLPSGLISAVIIGVGMRQAWRMTGVPHVVITGPFEVAPSPPVG